MRWTWTLCILRTLCRHVTIGTPMVIFAVRLFLMIGTLLVQSWLTSEDWYTNGRFCCFACLLTVFDDWYTVGTVKTAKMTIGVPIITVYQDCTNSVTTVHQSSKTDKKQSKQQK